MLRQCNWSALQKLSIPISRISVFPGYAFRFRVALISEHFNVRPRVTSTKSAERSTVTTEGKEQRWRGSLLGSTDGDRSGREDASSISSKALRPRPRGRPKGGAQQRGKAQDGATGLKNGKLDIVRRLKLSKAKQRVYEGSTERAVRASQDVKATGLAEQQDHGKHLIRYHRSLGAFFRPSTIRDSIDQSSNPLSPTTKASEDVVAERKPNHKANKSFRRVRYRHYDRISVQKFVAYREPASERIRRRFRRWERNRQRAMGHEVEDVSPTSERQQSDTGNTYHADNEERSDVFFTEHLEDAIDDLTYAPPKAPAAVRKLRALDRRRLPTVTRQSVGGANKAGEYVSEDCIPVSVVRKGGS